MVLGLFTLGLCREPEFWRVLGRLSGFVSELGVCQCLKPVEVMAFPTGELGEPKGPLCRCLDNGQGDGSVDGNLKIGDVRRKREDDA